MICFCTHSCLFALSLRNSGNKLQNNPLVSTEAVRHSSSYIIRYNIHHQTSQLTYFHPYLSFFKVNYMVSPTNTGIDHHYWSGINRSAINLMTCANVFIAKRVDDNLLVSRPLSSSLCQVGLDMDTFYNKGGSLPNEACWVRVTS